MKVIKPLYFNDKNLISYLLTPFTIFTILINFSKNFLIKKKYKFEIIHFNNQNYSNHCLIKIIK